MELSVDCIFLRADAKDKEKEKRNELLLLLEVKPSAVFVLLGQRDNDHLFLLHKLGALDFVVQLGQVESLDPSVVNLDTESERSLRPLLEKSPEKEKMDF